VGRPDATALTIVQVANRLQVSRSTAYELVARRELDVADVRAKGKKPMLRVTEQALADFLERRKLR
jgi:excisionase family DNA binding protein